MTLLSSAPYTNDHKPDRQRQETQSVQRMGHLQAVGLGGWHEGYAGAAG
jgi:hypothetical protein